MVAACQTARLDNIAPQSAAPLPSPSAAASATDAPVKTADAATTSGQDQGRTASAGAARDTGTYPDLNVAPPVATSQITDSEEAASKAQLNALRQQAQGTSAPAVSDQRSLRRLGRAHTDQVLKEIEAGEGAE